MSRQKCKVCRVLEKRDMERYEDHLITQWQTDSPERKGYRPLADWLNIVMLRREMDRSGMSTLGDEARSKYERLQSNESALTAEIKSDLESNGIRVEELLGDFVSYGVIRTHLVECLGLEYVHESDDWEFKSIDISLDRARSKVKEAISSLKSKQELEMGENTTVRVVAEIECEECHVRQPISRVRRRGYECNCQST